VFVGYDAAGKPRQVSRSFTGSRRAAERFAAEVERELGGVSVTAVESSVADLLDEWHQHHGEWAPMTRRDNLRRAAAIKTDPIARFRVMRLRVRDIDTWIARMRRDGVGEAEIRNRFNALRAALTDAERWEWIPSSPASRVRLRQPATVERPLMPTELVVSLLEAAARRDPLRYLALRLAAVTGAREAELAALRWTDRRGDQLTFDSQVQVVDGVRVDRAMKSVRSVRSVTLDAATAEAWAIAAQAVEVPRTYVFGHKGTTEPPSPRRVYEWFRAALRDVESSGWRFHDLRHWSASVALGNGHDLRAVAGRLGNTPDIVLRTYAHLLPMAEAAIATSVGDSLRSLN
jgi:integrase